MIRLNPSVAMGQTTVYKGEQKLNSVAYRHGIESGASPNEIAWKIRFVLNFTYKTNPSYLQT